MFLPSVHTITKVFGWSAGTQVHRDGRNRVAVSLDFCLNNQTMVMATQLCKNINKQLDTALPKRNSMMGKLHFKKTTLIPDEVVYDYNSSIWEAGAGGFLRVQDPSGV